MPRFPASLLLLALLSPRLAAEPVEVQIEGVEGRLLDNVRAHLAAARLGKDADLNEAQIRRLHRAASDQIQAALAPYGHYSAEIDAELALREGRWELRYRIDPGEPVRLRQVALLLAGPGANDEVLLGMREDFPLRPGDPLETPPYETFKTAWQTRALARGFLDASYRRSRIEVDAAAGEAAIELTLDTGPRYRLGPVHFNNGGLNPDLLQRYVHFDQGAPYSNAELLRLQSVLEDTGYFDAVDVIPLRERIEDQAVPVQVDLSLRKRQRYTAGLGFGTDTGPRATFGWEHRRINKRGHQLGAELALSTLRQSLDLRYAFPVGNPASDRIEFTAGVNHQETDTSTTRQARLGGAWVHGRGSWRETLSLSFQRDNFEIGGVEDNTTLLLPGVKWSRTRSDGGLNPRRGSRLSFGVVAAAEALLSDTDLLHAHAGGKWIHPVGAHGRLLARLEIGALSASRFEKVPASLRFFAGGDNSVRGYALEELGPRDAGEVIGGRQLLVGSLEYDRRIQGNWGLAAFVDAGNAYDDLDFSPRVSAGIGLRYHTPIGPVRLDIAQPLNDTSGWRLHFTLGPDL